MNQLVLQSPKKSMPFLIQKSLHIQKNTIFVAGEMAEWSNAAVLKTVILYPRNQGFESLFLRKKSNPYRLLFRVDRDRDENPKGSPSTKSLAKARIPFSPQKKKP